ncbi:MAG: DUF1800 domain-containing protein [Bacteroidota bacterium]
MSKINHLYWRAGFGLSPQEWAERKDWSIDRAVEDLFRQAKKAPTLPMPSLAIDKNFRSLNEKERKEILKKERQNVLTHNINWVKRMADPKASALLERMTLFWHGHFACRSRSGKLAVQQIATIREHALGSFKALVLGIARDPAMIRYLNNQQNKKQQPNENFARELMELFTIGRGHYTESDIKEAARAFTGWSSTLDGKFVFRRVWHDYDPKTFMGKTGRWDGEDIIDIILEQPATATFIVRKVYQYFVNEQVNERHVSVLSRVFYESNYDITLLMRTLLTSSWFYSPQNMANKIKSPVELLAGMMRSLNIDFKNELNILFVEKALGQVLFNPPNVAGWPGGQSWIDNSTLMMRLNLATLIIGASEFDFQAKMELEEKSQKQSRRKIEANADLNPLAKLVKGKSDQEKIASLGSYFLLKKPKVGPDFIKEFVQSRNQNEAIAMACMRLLSLPEYQLC